MDVCMLIIGGAMCLCHFCGIVYSWGFDIYEGPKYVFSVVSHVLSVSEF